MAASSGAEPRGGTDPGGAGETPEGALISVPDACRLLGVHRNTLYRLIREGEVPAFRLSRGGRWRFRRSDLEEWIEDRQARGVR